MISSRWLINLQDCRAFCWVVVTDSIPWLRFVESSSLLLYSNTGEFRLDATHPYSVNEERLPRHLAAKPYNWRVHTNTNSLI